MKTYLELVNEAIAEAKVTLDPLTSANFASPPRTILYNRFKTWVARAYKELLMRRKEWQFRMERGNLEVWPRLHLSSVTGTFAIGDVIEGADSGITATVKKIHTFEDVEGDGGTEVTLSLDVEEGSSLFDFFITEDINRTSPTSDPAIAVVKGLGRYKISDEVTNMKDIEINSIKFFDPDNLDYEPYFTVNSLGWDAWTYSDYPWESFGGRPELVTKAPDGNLEFYPRLDRNYIMHFNFNRKLPELVDWDDTPSEIPEEYEDYLMWKALADYADWDSNQRVYARASKNLETYLYWLERDELEDPHFGPNRFYGRY